MYTAALIHQSDAMASFAAPIASVAQKSCDSVISQYHFAFGASDV